MRILAVREVGVYLNELLACDEVLSDLWVSGEISNLSRSTAGHTYFTLKDAFSQIKCVLFKRASRDPWLAYLENGVGVIVHGRMALYEATGALQMYVDLLQPEGAGLLHLQFEYLKAKLENEGLFDPSRKRPIPAFPERIGVVTSPTGAVLHDILNVFGRRFPLVEVVFAPTAVQGDGAAGEIIRSIEALNMLDGIDVIIIARGGGSLEDLWSFNEESVARAIFASAIPVITGIGHETDLTIADLVADLRAPTPSAAAELAVPGQEVLKEQIISKYRLLSALFQADLTFRESAVNRLLQRLDRSVPSTEVLGREVRTFTDRIVISIDRIIETQIEQNRSYGIRLNTLNPLATLQRGYALVLNSKTQEVIGSVSQVNLGDDLDIRLSDGTIRGQVSA